MLVVVGGVVVHASCRVPGYASCREEGSVRELYHDICSDNNFMYLYGLLCLYGHGKPRDGKDRKVG